MKLSPEESDILRELINIGVGKAAGVLNQMTGFHIDLHVPSIKILTVQEMIDARDSQKSPVLSAVYLGFEGQFSGVAGLVFPTQSASLLVSILTGEESVDADLDEIRVGTLTEIGNIVVNGVMGSIGNVLKQHLMYTTPTYMEDTMPTLMSSNVDDTDSTLLMAETRFSVKEKDIEGGIILTFGVGSFDALLELIHSNLD